MLRQFSSLPLLFVGLLVGALAPPAAAQSAASVVDQMQARYLEQVETVDTYIVETNLYTSYNKKVTKDGAPTYQTQTTMKDQSAPSIASTSTPTVAYGLQYDRLKEQATYAGTETIDGTSCHLLQVNEPSKVNPDVSAEDASSMTYYVDANRHVPLRIVMQSKKTNPQGPNAASVTVNMSDYRTVDGLTLPYRLELQFDMDLSDRQRRQMEKALKKMENMSEQQRKQMESMMGGQMEMMKKMMTGEPMVVEVQDVQVNVDLPEGTF